jgi:AraC-like DNA-binding protein
MEHAAKTLKDDEISIKELASLSGFDDISSFSRMFKRKMGVSPAKYLTMHKRK